MNKSQNQFTYMDGEEFVFMNLESFEEIKLPRDDSWAKYLKEGMSVSVLTWNGKIIGVEMPNSVVLKVVETAGSDAGNTKGAGAQKQALAAAAAAAKDGRGEPPRGVCVCLVGHGSHREGRGGELVLAAAHEGPYRSSRR